MTGPSRADDWPPPPNQQAELTGSPVVPIAIIGIGCRFPGGVTSPESFWQLLVAGGDAIGEIPADRFVVDTYYDARPGADGKIISRQGGFLEAIDRFDAAFFGISPREAAAIDPQQRLLLEVGWEALEDAGQAIDRLANSRTGVFVGLWTSDYEDRLFGASSAVDLYTTTGGGRYAAAGRLSYTFNFQGPSLTVDTACSSSLVAVHLACQSLRSGESELALAGGVNLILQPEITIGYSRSGMLSPDGRCKFGDARADGYVRSEGVGLVVLKPLERAVADGDPIYAIIRGSAVNNDGRTGDRLVAPGQVAQERMLRAAYQQAGVVPGQVDYVEAHGTGTRVGDVVELQALGAVLAEGRPPDQPCRIGSVKTNIGHTEAASGIAGLIKAALCLQQQLVPASLHCEQPNPNVPWTSLPLAMQVTPAAWPRHDRPRLAGVNSFGVTGTNAHIVLQEAPLVTGAVDHAPQAAAPAVIVPISAQTPVALGALLERYRTLLTTADDQSWLALGATAARRRGHQASRQALVGRHRTDVLAGLDQALAKVAIRSNRARPLTALPRVLLVFPGQGGQWIGMGRRLLAEQPAFATALAAVDAALRPHLGWSLYAALAAAEPVMAWDQIDDVQPAIFAVQVGLAAVWRAWGIEPAAVLGHSLGEVAAAACAGVLTLEEAATVVVQRSRLMQTMSGQGAVGIVGLSLIEAQAALAPYGDRLCVAVSNGPSSTGIAGEATALDELLARLAAGGTFARRVQVDVAAHSPQMEPLVPRLCAALADLRPRPGQLELYSTVTGRLQPGAGCGPAYWGANLRQPVLFTQALQTAVAAGVNTIIEVSPHPVLRTAIDETLAALGQSLPVVGSLRRDGDDPVELLQALAQLYEAGYPVDWSAVYPTAPPVVRLPHYAWQRERHWLENDQVPGSAGRSAGRAASGPPAHAPADEWLHAVQWVTVAAPVASAANALADTVWLIMSDRQGIGTALAAQLRDQGIAAELLFASEFDAAHLRERLVVHLSRQARPPGPIVHLWSLDTTEAVALTADTLAVEQWLVSGSAALVAQALATQSVVRPARLWLVTRGGQVVAGTAPPPALSQTPLWGLGRVMAIEQPAEWGALVDLDPEADASINAQALWQRMQQPDGEEQCAVRAGAWYVPRLGPLVTERAAARTWRPDAAYLITGGLGDLGLQTARLLAESGARRLILMGRTPLPPRDEWSSATGRVGERIRAIRELEALGVSVQVAAVDVASETELRAYLDQYCREGWPAIRGVFHTAGVTDDQLLLHHDAVAWSAVLRPKVVGAWLLHSLLPDLDCFVLFSSIAALLSQPGQGSYAAANAFLDGLVAYRRVQGQVGLSINWSAWLDRGLAAASGAQLSAQRLADLGVLGLSATDGVAALQRLLERPGVSQVMVAPIVAATLANSAAVGRSPLLANLVSATAGDQTALGVTPASQPAWRLATSAPKRRALLTEVLRQHVGAILRLEPQRIDPAMPLGTYGVESLAANELRVRLERELAVALSATLVWNYPTLDALADYLLDRLQLGGAVPTPAAQVERGATEPAPSASAVELDTLMEQVAELSEEEALQRLLHGG